MENNQSLVPFEYNGQRIRSQVVDGVRWYVLTDILAVFGYRATAVSRVATVVLSGYVKMINHPHSTSNRAIWHVNDSGVIKLGQYTHKPGIADGLKQAQLQVTLAIKETGGYVAPGSGMIQFNPNDPTSIAQVMLSMRALDVARFDQIETNQAKSDENVAEIRENQAVMEAKFEEVRKLAEQKASINGFIDNEGMAKQLGISRKDFMVWSRANGWLSAVDGPTKNMPTDKAKKHFGDKITTRDNGNGYHGTVYHPDLIHKLTELYFGKANGKAMVPTPVVLTAMPEIIQLFLEYGIQQPNNSQCIGILALGHPLQELYDLFGTKAEILVGKPAAYAMAVIKNHYNGSML